MGDLELDFFDNDGGIMVIVEKFGNPLQKNLRLNIGDDNRRRGGELGNIIG